ncbi:hypothetical protein Csa_016069, partial [Cucumis sativus]
PTTTRDPRQNPLRRFPSRIVLLRRRLDRRRGRHHPTNPPEFEHMDMAKASLFNIP